MQARTGHVRHGQHRHAPGGSRQRRRPGRRRGPRRRSRCRGCSGRCRRRRGRSTCRRRAGLTAMNSARGEVQRRANSRDARPRASPAPGWWLRRSCAAGADVGAHRATTICCRWCTVKHHFEARDGYQFRRRAAACELDRAAPRAAARAARGRAARGGPRRAPGRTTRGCRPTRALAADLGVSRRLVVDAYAQLLAEGYLTARAGAGTFVAAGAVSAAGRAGLTVAGGRCASTSSPAAPTSPAFPRRAWLRAQRGGAAGGARQRARLPRPARGAGAAACPRRAPATRARRRRRRRQPIARLRRGGAGARAAGGRCSGRARR